MTCVAKECMFGQCLHMCRPCLNCIDIPQLENGEKAYVEASSRAAEDCDTIQQQLDEIDTMSAALQSEYKQR